MIHKKHIAHPLVRTTLSMYTLFLFSLITLVWGAFAQAVFAEGVFMSTFGITATSSDSDIIPPSKPVVSGEAIASDEVELTWPPATDNKGIMGYKVFRDGVLLHLVGETDYSDITVLPNTNYTYMVKAVDMSGNESLGALITLSTPDQSPLELMFKTASSSLSQKMVTFSVTPSTAPANCASGKAMTDVFFVLGDPDAGRFLLSRKGTIGTTGVEWGTHQLPNGIYYWKLMLNPEFTSEQLTTGTFTLSATCLTSAASSTTYSKSPMPPLSDDPKNSPEEGVINKIVAPLLPKETSSAPVIPKTRIVLKVFVDNEPVTDPKRVFADEDIELRVTGTRIKKVNFVALGTVSAQAIQMGNAVVDDLLSTDKGDVWTYVWSAKSAEEGTYKVFARVLRTDGTVIETPPAVLTIAHTESLAMSKDRATKIAVRTPPTAEEKAEILERVTDPGLCTNVAECEVFCASHPNANERCKGFARLRVAVATASPSLADTVPESRLLTLLENVEKRPKELPLVVNDVEALKAYCATPEHGDACAAMLLRNDLASAEQLAKKKDEVRTVHAVEAKVFTERVGTRAFVDSDGDGISDYDEINIYHTDPSAGDTDDDGVPDGHEILARTNPLGMNKKQNASLSTSGTTSVNVPTTSEEVRMENPLIAGPTDAVLLHVSEVAAVDTTPDQQGSTTAKVKISGNAPANSFITLFIFSDPIVVTVKSDESGAWTYTLDKELPDGTHQVVSAITDSGGRILAKSEPLPFVKEAAAVSLATLPIGVSNEAPSFWGGGSLFALIAVFVGLIGIALSVIGFMVHRRHDGDIQGGGTLAS